MCNTFNHSKHVTFSLNSVKQPVWRVRKRRSSQYCVIVVFFFLVLPSSGRTQKRFLGFYWYSVFVLYEIRLNVSSNIGIVSSGIDRSNYWQCFVWETFEENLFPVVFGTKIYSYLLHMKFGPDLGFVELVGFFFHYFCCLHIEGW